MSQTEILCYSLRPQPAQNYNWCTSCGSGPDVKVVYDHLFTFCVIVPSQKDNKLGLPFPNACMLVSKIQ